MSNPYPLEKKPRNKCHKWQLRAQAGKDPQTGIYRQKTRVFRGTWGAARRANAEFEAEVRQNRITKNITLADYLNEFVRVRELSGDFAPLTIKKYKTHSRALIGCLGYVKLSELTPAMIEDAYIKLRGGCSPSGGALSGTYLEGIHRTLSTALKRAVSLGYISSNPCTQVSAPKNDTEEKKALTSDGIAELLGKLGSSKHEITVLICITTGMRRGEVIGLSWGDVDLDSALLYVRHSYDDLGNLKVTKSKRSRIVPIPPHVVSVLREYKKRQALEFAKTRKELKSSTPIQTDETPVFADALGRRSTPHVFSVWWSRRRASYGLENWTLHELRHSYLTELARLKVAPRTLQKLAGHANVSTTLQIYTHTSLTEQVEAVASFGARFFHDSSMGEGAENETD